MIETSAYLGPATVHRSDSDGFIDVVLPDGQAGRARAAMPWAYRASPGDELLVIGGDPGELYAIGVLSGTGTAALAVPGDLVLSAPNGTVKILGGLGVRLESGSTVETAAPEVRIEAGRLAITARRVLEKAHEVYAWVSDLFQVKSRRIRAVAESTCHLKAREVSLRAEADMNIDGESVNLG